LQKLNIHTKHVNANCLIVLITMYQENYSITVLSR